jgi:histidinol phosphatase-like PHP family hydrolase
MMNFHIHTTWSDGTYTPEIIVKEAIKSKVDKIAITDHYSTQKTRSISPGALDKYVADIRTLRKKYEQDIDIYVGVEIDFSPRTDIHNLADFSELDFVLFEYVQDDLWEGYPLWMLLDLRKEISRPVLLAHNNLSRNFGNSDITALIRVLDSDRIGVELNTNYDYTSIGVPYYRLFDSFFDNIRDKNIPISVGSDVHDDLALLPYTGDALSFIQERHLENNFKLFLKEVEK